MKNNFKTLLDNSLEEKIIEEMHQLISESGIDASNLIWSVPNEKEMLRSAFSSLSKKLKNIRPGDKIVSGENSDFPYPYICIDKGIAILKGRSITILKLNDKGKQIFIKMDSDEVTLLNKLLKNN